MFWVQKIIILIFCDFKVLQYILLRKITEFYRVITNCIKNPFIIYQFTPIVKMSCCFTCNFLFLHSQVKCVLHLHSFSLTVLGPWPVLVIRSTDIVNGSGLALVWSVLAFWPFSEGCTPRFTKKKADSTTVSQDTGSVIDENDLSFRVFISSLRLSPNNDLTEVVV